MAMTRLDTEVLSALIDKKHECLVCLRDMGRRQYELVHEGSITGVLDVLSAKQDVLVRLQSIERALDPFRHDDPEARQWSAPERRQLCAQQLQRCEELLGEILAQERQSEQELIRRRDETAEQLQGMHTAGHARGAYIRAAARTSHHLDLSSER